MKREMGARFDARKQFYGKAMIVDVEGGIGLESYGTLVCSIDSEGNFHRHWDGWSSTTGRHIVEFVKQHMGSGRHGTLGKFGPTCKPEWDVLKAEPAPRVR